MNQYRQRDAAAFSSLPKGDPLRASAVYSRWLAGVFFGLSIVFWVLAVLADARHPGTISIYVWGRAITETILSLAFFLFGHLWWRGKFWGYMRMLMTSALGLASTLSVVALAGNYPGWLRLEQAVQAVVAVAMLYKLTRPAMRRRFAKKQ